MNVRRISSWPALLSASLEGYKKNYFILIPALIPIIFSVFVRTISIYMNDIVFFSNEFFYASYAFIMVIFLGFVTGVYVSAGMYGIIKESIRKNSGISSLREFCKCAKAKFPSLLGAQTIVGTVMVFIMMASVLALGPVYTNIMFALPVAFVCFVVLAAAVIFLTFTPYAVVLTNLKAIEGIKESMSFARKNMPSIALLFIIIFALLIPITLIAGVFDIIFSPYVSSVLYSVIMWLAAPYFLFLQGYYYAAKTKRGI